MRLHSDAEPDPSEPDDGWVTAGEAPSGTLSDVLQTWTVVRRWRGVKAPSAAVAIEATRGQVEVDADGYRAVLDHDDVRVTRGELVMLCHSRAELDAVAALLDDRMAALSTVDPRTPEIRAELLLLNSLRTMYAEAGYELDRQQG